MLQPKLKVPGPDSVQFRTANKGASSTSIIFAGLVLFVIVIAILIYGSRPKYTDKATKNEAITYLRAIMTAERAFRSEYHTYTTDLEAIGFHFDFPKIHYHVGFVKPSDDPTPPHPSLAGSYDVNHKDSEHLSSRKIASHSSIPQVSEVASHCADCTATKKHFKAMAWGILKTGKLDIWTIDDKNQLNHIVNGE